MHHRLSHLCAAMHNIDGPPTLTGRMCSRPNVERARLASPEGLRAAATIPLAMVSCSRKRGGGCAIFKSERVLAGHPPIHPIPRRRAPVGVKQIALEPHEACPFSRILHLPKRSRIWSLHPGDRPFFASEPIRRHEPRFRPQMHHQQSLSRCRKNLIAHRF